MFIITFFGKNFTIWELKEWSCAIVSDLSLNMFATHSIIIYSLDLLNGVFLDGLIGRSNLAEPIN